MELGQPVVTRDIDPQIPRCWCYTGQHILHQCSQRTFAKLPHGVLNVKAIEGAFSHEKALEVAFSVIVKSSRTFV